MERGKLIARRYELVKRLGRGGMGEVWAGRDRSLHRDVAVKLLALDDAPHPELALRFEREAVAAAQINHPNAVALYDRGVHEDALFLIMEKVEGATLAEHIRDESPMAPARALEIAHGICAALVAAHQAGVIHYDIKPHNVMITPEGHVKVVDFGIAGFIQTMFTVAGSSQLTPAGTPEPESTGLKGRTAGDLLRCSSHPRP
ncbi:serine/threonine-protein kinase [Kitasatospora sp. NPDC059673]|uniref:serine/threonine-protein kinase n=1 Tax=Kitasatospora sp. NPDC059673 TaxID=3346901 RepID=UPI0036A4763D